MPLHICLQLIIQVVDIDTREYNARRSFDLSTLICGDVNLEGWQDCRRRQPHMIKLAFRRDVLPELRTLDGIAILGVAARCAESTGQSTRRHHSGGQASGYEG